MKVLGVAPGADVDVMKVLGDTNVGFTSGILQGIDWADPAGPRRHPVHVVRLHAAAEHRGGQPLSAILKNAMSDGITVVASTGDSSPSNTEGSPALNPGVIGAAASTSYRLMAQTNSYLYYLAQAIHKGSGTLSYQLGQSTPGWLDNEVSTLSSSGVTEERRAPDLIAPGDLNWADCSTDTTAYTDCADYLGGSADRPPGVRRDERVGPAHRRRRGARHPGLPRGARRRHADACRRPADPLQQRDRPRRRRREPGLGPAQRAAGSRAGEVVRQHSTDGGLLHSPDNIAALGKPGASFRHTVKVTNSGSSKATIRPVLRTLGPAHTLASGKLNLFAAGKGPQGSCAGHTTAKYYDDSTIPELSCKTFTVPKGVDLLDSRIGWNPLQNCSSCAAEPTVREILIDPKGRYAQYSDPQGNGSGFADEQIHQPAAGKWTLLIFGRTTSIYEGKVSYEETTQNFRTVKGAVKPASKVVRPGQVGLVRRQGAGSGHARVLDRRGRLPQQPRVEARHDPRRLRGEGAGHRQEGRALHRDADRRQRAARGPSRRSSATSSRCRRASTTWT